MIFPVNCCEELSLTINAKLLHQGFSKIEILKEFSGPAKKTVTGELV
jgi:hypothetical protein